MVMAIKAILLFASSMAPMAMGAAVNNNDECGAPDPTEEHIVVAREMSLNESMTVASEFSDIANINVPVYVHIVSKDENEHPKSRDIRAMMADMTENYKDMGFRFSLQNISYTVNVEWSSGENEMAMKKTLRKGNYKTLNLYYVNTVRPSATGKIAGKCHLPAKDGNSGNTLILDGCVIRRDGLSNSQTTTHEVGHWLGLFHTFHGGCTGSGDMVADTPACQKTWSCDDKTKTCPGLPGNDAVHNFMAYGKCRTQFTAGQGRRARSQYRFYRA